MNNFIFICLLFISAKIVSAQEKSILGELTNTSVITLDSIVSFNLDKGFLVIKTDKDNRIYSPDSDGGVLEVFNYTDKVPLDPKVRNIFQKSEYTGYESHNYIFYDSLGNVLFDIPRSKYSYDVTSDGKWMFTKSVYDGGYFYLFKIENKTKYKLSELQLEENSKAINPNDSSILTFYDHTLYVLDLVNLEFHCLISVNHIEYPNWFLSSFDNSLLLSWGDTLYYINPDCEIQWKKTYGEKQKDLSVIGRWIINATASQTDAQAIIHTYDRTKHYFSLIDLITQKETELFSFTKDSIHHINLGELTFIDDILLMQPAYYQWENAHFDSVKSAYFIKVNTNNQNSIQSEKYSQKILFEKTANGYRTFMRSDTNQNQLMIKDWLR